MSKKIKVVVTRKLPDAVETRMMELFDATLNLDDVALTREQLIEAVQSCEILVPTVTDSIDAEIIEAASDNMKMLANFGNGVDHIDLSAASKRNIVVTNTPDVLTEDTADLTMALILMTPRRLGRAERILRSGKWDGWRPTSLMGHRIHDKRLGIIGLGRIGTAVAQRAHGFGLSVHYHNRHRVHEDIEAELEATYWESLDQMLARMDIVSIHCPYTPATYHLLSARRLRLIRKDAYIVNTARGEIVDESVLIEMLENGDLSGAGLDVYMNEPDINPKFLEFDSVVLLPHIASATLETRVDMGEKVLINIRTLFDGNAPPDRVFAQFL